MRRCAGALLLVLLALAFQPHRHAATGSDTGCTACAVRHHTSSAAQARTLPAPPLLHPADSPDFVARAPVALPAPAPRAQGPPAA